MVRGHTLVGGGSQACSVSMDFAITIGGLVGGGAPSFLQRWLLASGASCGQGDDGALRWRRWVSFVASYLLPVIGGTGAVLFFCMLAGCCTFRKLGLGLCCEIGAPTPTLCSRNTLGELSK